jgi:hypothetical protein
MLKKLLKLASAYGGQRSGDAHGAYGKPWKKGWKKKARYGQPYGRGWDAPRAPGGFSGYPPSYGYKPKGLKGFLLQALLSRFVRLR